MVKDIADEQQRNVAVKALEMAEKNISPILIYKSVKIIQVR